MAKRRSYRAYAPGSVQRKVNTNLRHAISELRHGRKGCKYARDFILQAENALYSGIGKYATALHPMRQTEDRKIGRVVTQFRRKCKGIKL